MRTQILIEKHNPKTVQRKKPYHIYNDMQFPSSNKARSNTIRQMWSRRLSRTHGPEPTRDMMTRQRFDGLLSNARARDSCTLDRRIEPYVGLEKYCV